MLLGPDGRMYIGQGSGTFGGLPVINYPNNKGAACGYCPRCLWGVNSPAYSPTAPSSMPNYLMSASPSLCWPTATNFELGILTHIAHKV
jgi:hypothetical protein